MTSDEAQKARARQGRLATIVIIASALVSVGGTWIGEQLGWSNRTLGLIGLVAMGGFAFGLVVAIRIWLSGRKDEG
ncbi:DUF5337 domain-containing protein [Maritimibacter dapengensis]|uniref:DUF5337 domain-containing protein n=1 Tax=Maritimibacter dapengensis TaxID=2836868 RepID=A0ABS6T1Y4_9RHOB|nr:DUF5337 domain-containing protein [Maritimibacter dapengensis]MBV7379109.1 DUF5337 domain-containing protein [Maritimibacter dapengensis]